jgi:hypothetical protein
MGRDPHAGLRELTQHASRLVYNSAFDGIRYLSRYGHNICNWASDPLDPDSQRFSSSRHGGQ